MFNGQSAKGSAGQEVPFKLDLAHLQELREQRLVSLVYDAASGLTLANYSPKAQYDQKMLYLAMDGKPYADVIWRLQEPKGTGSVPTLVEVARADL